MQITPPLFFLIPITNYNLYGKYTRLVYLEYTTQKGGIVMYMQIKDYAMSRGITYEAVRRQLKQYAKDLEGHVTKKGKTYLLDDQAVTILDGHRINKTVVVEPTDNMVKDEVERLKAEIDQLKNQVIALQNDKIKYVEDKAKADALLLIADKEHDELEKTKQELTTARIEIANKDQELERYTKTIFGLYRRSDK